MEKTKINTQDLSYISLFSAVMALCSWISIPSAVPFTLQTFGVFSSILILGGRRSSISILVYLLLGAVGLPVFAGFTGGLGRLFGSTGGYLFGFLGMSLLYWVFEKKVETLVFLKVTLLVMGLMLDYIIGTIWFLVVYTANTGEIDLLTALFWCVIPYIIPDLCKLSLAMTLEHRIKKYVKP